MELYYSIVLSRMLLENIQDTILISVHCNNPSSMVSTDGVRELSEKEGKMNIIPLFFYSFTSNIKTCISRNYVLYFCSQRNNPILSDIALFNKREFVVLMLVLYRLYFRVFDVIITLISISVMDQPTRSISRNARP